MGQDLIALSKALINVIFAPGIIAESLIQNDHQMDVFWLQVASTTSVAPGTDLCANCKVEVEE